MMPSLTAAHYPIDNPTTNVNKRSRSGRPVTPRPIAAARWYNGAQVK